MESYSKTTFMIFALLGFFACVSANTEVGVQDEGDEHSNEMMLYIMGLADDIVQEGGDPIDVLEEALAKLRGAAKPRRSPSEFESAEVYDQEHRDESFEHDHHQHADKLFDLPSHSSGLIDSQSIKDGPKQTTSSLVSEHHHMEDGIETTTNPVSSKSIETGPENTTVLPTMAASASEPIPTVASSASKVESPLPPHKSTKEVASEDKLAMVPVPQVEIIPKLDSTFKVSKDQLSQNKDHSLNPEPLVSSSITASKIGDLPSVGASSSVRDNMHPAGFNHHDGHDLPSNDHEFEDEYIDESDPSDPKLVQIKKKVRNEVGPNGHIQEHHESHSSTSLGNNPNSFSRSSSSSSSTSSSSSSSFSSHRSGLGGHPGTVSDTVITTDNRPNLPFKKQKHRNNRQFMGHHQAPFGSFSNMAMMPHMPQMPFMPPMPPMPPMPMMPYGMGWPNYYGGQTFGSFGKQPAGGFSHVAPGGAGAYSAAFASAGGIPSSDYLDFQSGDRKRRHASRHLNAQVSKKSAQKLGYRKSPQGYWTV